MSSDPAKMEKRPGGGERPFPRTYFVHTSVAGRTTIKALEFFPQAVRGPLTLLYEGNIYELDGHRVAGRATTSIAERFLRLYCEQGEAIFQKVIGEFSVIVLDKEGGLAFRSLTSPHQIYFTDAHLSNHLLPFFAVDADRCRSPHPIDESYILDFLIRKSPGYAQSLKTPFQGIHRVPAGASLRFGPGSQPRLNYLGRSRFSALSDYSQKAEDLGPALREILKQAVDDRIAVAGNRAIACELSGGLDSSFICSLLAQSQKKISAYMFSYPMNPSHRFSEDCATAVAEMYPDISFQIYPPDFFLPHDLDRNNIYSDEPSNFLWQGALFCSKMASVLPEDSVIFSGIGSDQLFLRQPTALPWLLRHCRFSRFFKLLKEMAPAVSRGTASLFYQSLLTLIPAHRYVPWMASLKKIPFNLISFEDINSQFHFLEEISWLGGQGGRAADLQREILRRELEEQRMVFGNDTEIRCSLEGAAVPQHSLVPCLSHRGIDYQMPYYDLRLLHFVYEKVSWHLIHDWKNPYKHLLREAQKDVVADSTRTRIKNEFHFDGFLGKLLKQNETFIRSLFARNELLDSGLVNRKELQLALEKRFLGINNNSSTRSLTSLIFYLLWSDNFEKARKRLVGSRLFSGLSAETPSAFAEGILG